MLQMLRCYGKISYLCVVFNRIKRKRRIYRLCLEHARQYSMEREFRMACGLFGNPLDALEEWDLLNNEIKMKIKAEYNQLIDIELPPHWGGMLHSSHRGRRPHAQNQRARRRAAAA